MSRPPKYSPRVHHTGGDVPQLYDLLGEFAPPEHVFYNRPRSMAERVVFKFGGVQQLIRALKNAGYNVAPSTVYKWLYPPEKGGTGGIIPTRAWKKVLEAAKLEGLLWGHEEFDVREFALKSKGNAIITKADRIIAQEAPHVLKKPR